MGDGVFDWTVKKDFICCDCSFLISDTFLKLVTETPIVNAGKSRSCISRNSGMTLSQSDLGLLRYSSIGSISNRLDFAVLPVRQLSPKLVGNIWKSSK